MRLLHNIPVLFYLLANYNNVDAQLCAMLYKEGNYSGENKFPMVDGSQVVNFEEEYITVDTVWNNTGSFMVQPGCTLMVCNDTNFMGQCEQVKESQSQPMPQEMGYFLSASCQCNKNCNCSDIKMRKTSCGRLYYDGCDKCNAPYLDLTGNSMAFSADLIGNNKAIKVRSGCNLTIFPDEEQEGEEIEMDSSIDHWNFEGSIGSFQCKCNPSLYVPQPKQPRPPSYPKMINIPSTIEGVSNMLQGEYGRHPGLLAAMSSLKNKRSSKNAYILTVGSTGSGKSSAINLLFDNPNVTAVGDGTSTTSDIHEFRISVPIDELGIQNSELRVIDTPGLLDTRGLDQDAKFLATLDDYLSNHEELHNKIPNIVFVFHKFTDNRFNGSGSSFVKMLRGLDSFKSKITDDTYSNVVFVFSHFCSETSTIKKRPKQRLQDFKQVIQEYSLFPKPIVLAVAENKADEHNLPLVNGYYKLPNGDFYPRNLFDTIQKITQSSSDSIGDAVFRTAFRDSENFNISSITYKLVGTGNKKVPRYFDILSKVIFNIETTEISQLLDKAFQTMDPVLIGQYADSLPYLQKSLNIRNIRTRTDIPKTTLDILELIKSLRQNEAILYLLEHGLQITPPIFPSNVVAGHSFHVFKDAPLSRTPFGLGDYAISDIGFLFPTALTCSVERSVVDFIQIHSTREDYIQKRMVKLGIEGNIPVEQFSGEIKPGFNIESESFTNTSCSFTAVREIRTFELILQDKPALSKGFEKVLLELPPYNETDHEVVLHWNNFFANYGTHVVRSVYGGGAIEIVVKSGSKCDSVSITKALFNVVQFAEDLVSINRGNGSNSTLSDLDGEIKHQLKFRGGDQKYHTTDLTKMTLDDASELLNKWKASLNLNPTILTTEMNLVPISEIAKKVGKKQNITIAIQQATSLYFNSELKYRPKLPPHQQPVGEDRQHVPLAQSSSGFAELMQIMMNQAEESNKRFEAMMTQMAADRQANEERRDRERQEQRAWEREQAALQFNLTLLDRQEKADQEARRQQQLLDMMAKQEKAEQDWKNELARQQSAAASALAAANEKNAELMRSIRDKPPPKTSSCLKKGTLITMANGGGLKPVEMLQVGDLVLDHNLVPTTVIGVSWEFLESQNYYGFDNATFFFTDSHIMVGPSDNDNDDNELQFYVKDMPRFLSQNPLMEFINPVEMEFGNFYEVYKIGQNLVQAEKVQVYKDPSVADKSALIYFLQVDSQSGTYFANGYACRHEIPPLDKWPKTMEILFKIFNTQTMQSFNGLEYTMSTVEKMKVIAENVHQRVAKALLAVLPGICSQNLENIFANQDGELVLAGVFNDASLGAMSTKLYGAVGKMLSNYLDNADSEQFIGIDCVVDVQNYVYNEMYDEFVESVGKFFNYRD